MGMLGSSALAQFDVFLDWAKKNIPKLPLRPQQGSLRQPRFSHAVFVSGAVSHVLREKFAVKNGRPSMPLQVS
jgi:hypothetical protein